MKNALNGLLAKLLNHPFSEPSGGVQPSSPQSSALVVLCLLCVWDQLQPHGTEESDTLPCKASGQDAFPDPGGSIW